MERLIWPLQCFRLLGRYALRQKWRWIDKERIVSVEVRDSSEIKETILGKGVTYEEPHYLHAIIGDNGGRIYDSSSDRYIVRVIWRNKLSPAFLVSKAKGFQENLFLGQRVMLMAIDADYLIWGFDNSIVAIDDSSKGYR